MRLSLDHLIIRTATPEETLGALAAQAGAPVLAGVEEVRGLASGIVRAGSIDIEVLRIGDEQPSAPQGYGVGLVADAGLDAAVARLRELGLGTSAAPRVTAGDDERRRAWRAAQVHGLLPDPFPVPVTTRRLGPRDRVSERMAGMLTRIPAVARAATRRAGSSMVVVTEYEFDVAAWRASAGAGPRVLAVELGTGGFRSAWDRLPLAGDVRLQRDDDGPAGIRRVVLEGDGPGFAAGDVEFAFSG
jgi:hypothetical protein